MSDFVDLHCHWVAEIDDGARSVEEGIAILHALRQIGFAHVVATPHMRPGMFDNERADIFAAFFRMQKVVGAAVDLPTVSLGSEHFFDARVVDDIIRGAGLPYREQDVGEELRHGGAVLVEFQDLTPLPVIERQLFLLQTKGFVPVIAHPERYRAAWANPECVSRLVELGSVALLDVCALTGKYGEEPNRVARVLLENEVYDAACTDSHRPGDVQDAGRAIAWLEGCYGRQEVDYLFAHTPKRLLQGLRPDPG